MLASLFAALTQAVAPAAPDADALADMRTVEVNRIFPHWESYLDLDAADRDRFILRYAMRGPEDAALWLETPEGGVEALIPDERGHVDPPDRAAFEREALIRVDAPPGTMSVSMAMVPMLEPALSYEADALRTAAGQANAAMRKVAGVVSLFAPRMAAVRFIFDGPAPEAWAVMDNGERRALPVESDAVWFPVRERAFRRAVRVEFGAEPIALYLTPL